jgi:hypothetical protein
MTEEPILSPVFWIVWLAVVVFEIAAWWTVFAKAGKPGWAAIVPIYNIIVVLEIAGKPLWWILLCLIPLVNIVVIVMVYIAFARNFGKGVGFGWGLAFLGLIFMPILAWGDAVYRPQ